jgi:hypothetical protein
MHSTRRTSHASKIAQMMFVGLLVTGLSAQVSETRRGIGFPEDWTHHHIKFSTAALRQHPEIAGRDLRAAFQLYREARVSIAPAVASSVFTSDVSTSAHRDWSMPLGAGRINLGQYPAKWNNDPTVTPSCTADYIVYALNTKGVTGGQPNLIAYNHLYTGITGTPFCPGTNPIVLFGYNTTTSTAGSGGVILTSPVLNSTGTKVAFVETNTTVGSMTSILHVLSIPANGTPNQGTATVAVAPAMSSTVIAAASNMRSAPWIDYPSDTAYVGLDNGKLYKITGVFNGTPTLAGAPWPATVRLNRTLTSPVLDVTGIIYLGASDGILYSVNSTTGTVITSLAVGSGGTYPNIDDAPLLDSTGGQVFAVSPKNATTNTAVVVQATTGLIQKARVSIGLGSAGNGGANLVRLFDGDFDVNFTTPSTGHMKVCGTGAADTTPHLYTLGFNSAGILQPGSSVQLSTNTASRCGPITEVFNPNIGAGTDFFFWGVSSNCSAGPAGGCVMSLVNGAAGPVAAESGGASGIIIDNFSTQQQASSIYFSTGAVPNNAVKLTQQGLN